MRWVVELMNYDYKIEHKPGINIEAADALSRLPKFPKSTATQPEISADPHIMTIAMENSENQDEILLTSDANLQIFDWQQASIFEDADNKSDLALVSEVSHEYCFDIKKIDIIAEQK